MSSLHGSERTLQGDSIDDSKFAKSSIRDSGDSLYDAEPVLYADKFITLTGSQLIVKYICLLMTKYSERNFVVLRFQSFLVFARSLLSEVRSLAEL